MEAYGRHGHKGRVSKFKLMTLFVSADDSAEGFGDCGCSVCSCAALGKTNPRICRIQEEENSADSEPTMQTWPEWHDFYKQTLI